MIDEDVNMNVNQNSSVNNHEEIINNEQIKQSDEIDTFLGNNNDYIQNISKK